MNQHSKTEAKFIEPDELLGAEIEKGNRSLTDWKNPVNIKDLHNDYNTASTLRSRASNKVSEWYDLRNITGKENPRAKNRRPGRSGVSSRMVRRQAEWRYPALTEPFNGVQKLFTVKPRTWDSAEAARQHEILLNFQFSAIIDKVQFIDTYVRTCVDEGTVIVRVGWSTVTRKKKRKVPVVDIYPVSDDQIEIAETIMNGIQLKQESPKDFDALPIEVIEAVNYTLEFNQDLGEDEQPSIFYGVVNGTTEKEVDVIIRNEPTLEFVDVGNLSVDPNCKGNIDKAMYIIHTYNTTVPALREQGIYQNLDLIKPESTETGLSGENLVNNLLISEDASGKSRKTITVTEYFGYWDIEDNGVLEPIVVAYVGNVIIRCEKNPFPDKKPPFVLVQYMPVKNSYTGEPDAEIIADNQRIAGALERAMVDTIGRTARGQTGIAKGALDVVNRRKFESGEDFEYNPVAPDVRAMLNTLTPPEIPNSTMALHQHQSSTAESLTGIKSYGDGINSGSLGDVATGIKGALDAAAKREVSILRRLSSGLEKIGRKLIAMNQVFLEDEEVVRITNEFDNQITEKDSYIKIRRDNLAGGFDVEIDITTAEEDNLKAQELAFILQTSQGTVGPVVTLMILSKIAELRGMPDIAHKFRTYQPEPDPIEQAKAEAEVAKLQAEAQLTQARANEAQAKADYYQALASRGMQDFIDATNGVEHSRQMELRAEQAQSQEKLAETKVALDLMKETLKEKLATNKPTDNNTATQSQEVDLNKTDILN